jgi:hypothetical protein
MWCGAQIEVMLGEGQPARAADLTEAEAESVKGLMLLTMKKVRERGREQGRERKGEGEREGAREGGGYGTVMSKFVGQMGERGGGPGCYSYTCIAACVLNTCIVFPSE